MSDYSRFSRFLTKKGWMSGAFLQPSHATITTATGVVRQRRLTVESLQVSPEGDAC
jgi:hypothetical protein